MWKKERERSRGRKSMCNERLNIGRLVVRHGCIYLENSARVRECIIDFRWCQISLLCFPVATFPPRKVSLAKLLSRSVRPSDSYPDRECSVWTARLRYIRDAIAPSRTRNRGSHGAMKAFCFYISVYLVSCFISSKVKDRTKRIGGSPSYTLKFLLDFQHMRAAYRCKGKTKETIRIVLRSLQMRKHSLQHALRKTRGAPDTALRQRRLLPETMITRDYLRVSSLSFADWFAIPRVRTRDTTLFINTRVSRSQ